MVDNTYIDLIHGAIDGVNTPEEMATLQAYLDENDDARKLYEDLRAMTTVLAQVEAKEPPPHLKKRILNALPSPTPQPAAQKGLLDFLAPLRTFFEAKPSLAFAYAFTMGLVVGLAAYAVLSPGASFDPTSAAGTLISPEAAETSERIHTSTINADGVQGTVDVQSSIDVLWVELSLDAALDLDVRLTYNATELNMHGFSRLTNDAARITSGPGSIALTTTSEAGSYVFVFGTETTLRGPIQFEIAQGNTLLFEETLPTINQTP